MGLLKRSEGQWQGKLVLKGILHPDEAEQAKKIGLDGVMHLTTEADNFAPLFLVLANLRVE